MPTLKQQIYNQRSCLRYTDGKTIKTYLIKIEDTIPTVNSQHVIQHLDINEIYKYKISLKQTLENL